MPYLSRGCGVCWCYGVRQFSSTPLRVRFISRRTDGILKDALPLPRLRLFVVLRRAAVFIYTLAGAFYYRRTDGILKDALPLSRLRRLVVLRRAEFCEVTRLRRAVISRRTDGWLKPALPWLFAVAFCGATAYYI